MTEKELLYHRQQIQHNPCYLMGINKSARDELVGRLKAAAVEYGHDIPGFSTPQRRPN